MISSNYQGKQTERRAKFNKFMPSSLNAEQTIQPPCHKHRTQIQRCDWMGFLASNDFGLVWTNPFCIYRAHIACSEGLPLIPNVLNGFAMAGWTCDMGAIICRRVHVHHIITTETVPIQLFPKQLDSKQQEDRRAPIFHTSIIKIILLSVGKTFIVCLFCVLLPSLSLSLCTVSFSSVSTRMNRSKFESEFSIVCTWLDFPSKLQLVCTMYVCIRCMGLGISKTQTIQTESAYIRHCFGFISAQMMTFVRLQASGLHRRYCFLISLLHYFIKEKLLWHSNLFGYPQSLAITWTLDTDWAVTIQIGYG